MKKYFKIVLLITLFLFSSCIQKKQYDKNKMCIIEGKGVYFDSYRFRVRQGNNLYYINTTQYRFEKYNLGDSVTINDIKE